MQTSETLYIAEKIALLYKLSLLIGDPLQINSPLFADDGKTKRSIIQISNHLNFPLMSFKSLSTSINICLTDINVSLPNISIAS